MTPPLPLLLIPSLATLLLPPLAHATITLGQTQLGNIFLSTETVSIPARCDGDQLDWIVTDHDGRLLRRGTQAVQDGTAHIRPALGRRGYFELLLTEKAGGSTLSEARTRFAVLTPLPLSGRETSPFGVQTHSAQGGDPRAYALFARAGISHFRDEQYWEHVELQPRQYSYPASFSDFMNEAQSARLQPLLTLDWSHPGYDYSAGMFTAPHTDAGRAGYADYGAAIVERYPQLHAVEIWNEYNAGTFIAGPATADKPAYYTRMLAQTALRLRSVRDDLRIVAGGTVPVTHGFLRDIIAQGAMPYLDVVSVHPYRQTPEGIDVEIAELRALIKRHNQGAEKPIWATEFSQEVQGPADQRAAATYLAQLATLLLSQGVERMYYYLGLDDDSFPHRGLLASPQDSRGAFTPHPAYVAYANLIRQLRPHPFHSRYPGTASSTYAFRFQNRRSRLSVLWSREPVTVALRSSSALIVTDLMGHSRSLAPIRGQVLLRLGPDLLYVKGPVSPVIEKDNPVLADSLSGYSDTQGRHGWSYPRTGSSRSSSRATC
jgi:hypothetical protein